MVTRQKKNQLELFFNGSTSKVEVIVDIYYDALRPPLLVHSAVKLRKGSIKYK